MKIFDSAQGFSGLRRAGLVFIGLTVLLNLNSNYALASSAVRKDDLKAHAQHRLMQVALAQSEKMSPSWDPGQRDCAGFVRYLYRQTFETEGSLWKNRGGEKVDFVTASELIAYNFQKVSGVFDPVANETGDLLVFRRPDRKPEDEWHIMILLKPPQYAKPEWLVIYHNGARPPDGAVRVVSLTELNSTLHSEWRPTLQNASFLGVYRWNGWANLKVRNGK